MLFTIAAFIFFLLTAVSFMGWATVGAVWIGLSALFACIGLAVDGYITWHKK